MSCIVCGDSLSGRQTKYCSPYCKGKDGNVKYQSYQAQQERGRSRKLELVHLSGDCCSRCGYTANYSALEFHQVGEKSFQLDIRNCSNRRWQALLFELEECVLLCSNCHHEEYNPDSVMPPS